MPSRRNFLAGAAGAAAAAVSASLARGEATPVPTPAAPSVRARVLGIAQDAGIPQLGCSRSACVAARRDPSRARRVACLGISGAPSGEAFLIDATPDIRSQAAELGAPVGAILLTHAHIGHYTGLMYLGRESMAARALPVHATPRMAAFLKANKPWSRLVEWGHVDLRPLEPGKSVALAPGIEARPITVPHRDEDSDTVGFVVTGPSKRLLYVPDTDAFDRWERPLASFLGEVDAALLDGTFFDAGEIPGRDPAEVPHPLIRATIESLRGAAPSRCRVIFTHLSHENPALDPGSAAAAAIRDAGCEVAWEGMELAL
ncbi:MAG: MBL fold metallo-hydrolase [Acidobacteria bacterium]|nr:MBL fold metallo-hydrolase [Acidobacteriota bacterium]